MQQQAQANPQSHSQGHLLHRGQQHPGHAAHMHGYGSRSRPTGEVPQSSPHSGANSNPYRKDMEYYFTVSGRDRSRRGGMGYGPGFGFSNIDGHMPHQYRHAVGSGSSSGMMSPYPLDYASSAGSGGSGSSSSGAGSFSPSQQYSMGQAPSMQPVSASPMHQRQHSQKYPSHQALHQGQSHRSYALHSHRMPPQFSHYPSGSAGMYNSPPHRYDGSGSAGVDIKVNSSPTHSNPATSNSTGPSDSMGQPYPASHPPYSPQSHSLHKHAGLNQRNTQHSLVTGYDPSIKMQPHAAQASHAYSKHSQSSVPLASPAMPQLTPQEVSKSPMNSQTQPAQMQQNFSPISNPSPAASAVQSPSCSSSSSPLMGVSEGSGNASVPPVQPPSQSSISNPRSSSHSHGRLLQTVPQLSPTPHSNSSISSCGSSIGGKGSHPVLNTGRSGVGSKAGAAAREEGPPTIYPSCPQEKIMQDPGLNSLNALTSQVANLPNTVQHMMLTDSLLSSKRGKDVGQHLNVQSSSQVVPSSQSKTQGALGHGPGKEDGGMTVSDGSSSERTVAEDLSSRPERAVEAKEEQVEHFSDSEPKRLRQMSGTSNESETNNYYPPSKSHKEQSTSQPQNPPEQSCRRLPLRVDIEVSKKQPSTLYSNVGGAQMKTPDTQTPSSSSPPSVPPSAQPSPNLPHCLPPSSITSSSTPSPAHSSLSNCYLESDPANADSKNGVRERESSEIKMERNTKTESEEANKKWENIHRGDHGGLPEGDVSKKLQSIDNCKEEMLSPKQNENKEGRPDKGQNYVPDRTMNAAEPQHGGVGVIVSTRPDCNQPEMSKHPESTLLSPQYGGPLHSSQQNYSEDRKFLRDSRSHNGDGDGPVDQFPGQYDTSSKPDFGQMTPHMGAYKFGNHDMSFNTCMGMKNRGRMGPAAGMAANVRYQGYNQPQPTYGSVPRKNSGIMALDAQVRRAMGLGPRPEDNNSQMQQPYPSLLQEVLQGYHLDRRYGRSEHMNAHLQSPNMAQHPYHPRLPYGMIEGMKPHGVSSPALMGVHHAEMTPGKPHPLNQVQSAGNDLGPGVSHSTWDPDAQRLKGSHCGSIDQKSRIGASPNQSSHMQQPTDTQLIAGPPPKHINLADYSLPQRKSSSLTSPPSAVQQLLLQEVEPLAGSVTPTNQTQSASLLSPSSERRSVICDVSPSRRTPEQESHFGTPAASVIQPTFASATTTAQEQDNRKDQSGDKAEVKTEESVTTSEAPNQSREDLLDDATKKKGKCTVPSADTHSNHHRTSGGSIDLATTTRHHPHPPPHHSIQNPLMSPQRQQPCPQGLDVSGSLASAYTSYPYGDVREGSVELSKVHNPSYHGYGVTSSQSQLSNKSEGYPHPLTVQHAHDGDARLDWAGNTNRPSEMLMPNSDPHAPQNQPDRKMMSPTDGLTNSSQLPRQQPQYPGTYYDMKIWEAFAARESGGGILEGDSSTRIQQPAPEPVSAQPTVGSIHPETKSPRAVMEEAGKSLLPLPTSNSVSNTAGNTTSTGGNQGTSQGRQFRTGGSGEPNPLMMRRRVRSFISPIPAKRLHQDGTQKTGPSSYQSPHADPRYQNENESDATRSRLPSPNSCPTPNSQSPPSQGKTKVLPPRKGRGLKLEAIVQKITPSMKKGGDYNSHGDSDSNYPDTEPYCSEDQDIGARFSSGDSSCLPYLGDGQSLDEVLSYRGMDDTGPPPIIPYDSLKESSTGSSIGGALRGLQSDFDFGLGTSATPASLVGESDKDDLRIPSDFTLLGPLPPPPPLPRPVQGSPPPSSSALSDIQQFTNTYQQLETRRGEQSAANLLRQKLQETGMGFDEYSSGDYYGASPAHGQGHHLLSRSQHQGSSPRSGMSMSDSKPPENIVPKGYFPSGKKKGRPVGSVNKQKRAQQQQQQQQTQQPNVVPGSTTVVQASSPASVSAVPQVVASVSAKAEVLTSLTISSENLAPSAAVTPPAQQTAVKVDIEGEETQTEVTGKSGRHRQRKAKEDSEDGVPTSRQRRRRRAVPMPSKEEPDATNTGANAVGIFQDKQNNVFSPYIHVERKIAELGAVCTIVNAEEEKLKSGKGSGSGSGTDILSNLAQMVKRDKDMARVKENRVSEQVESPLQSGKALPSSGYVLPGPVISEAAHTGRLLCCLCQKWANYKHLGDLYGPYYPSEYVSKLPKNQPQVKQILSHPGSSTAGTSMVSNSADTNDVQLLDTANVKSLTDSDCTASHATNPTSPATTVGTASPEAGEEMPSLTYKTASATINRKVHNWELTHEKPTVTEPQKPPELQNEVTGEPKRQSQHQQLDDAQQWPQHRKLTSHPRFKRRHKSGEDLPRTIPSNNKASLPFQPPPPSLDSLGPLAQLAQLPQVPLDPEELWVHEGCITWASGVFLVSGKLYGLQETLEGARETVSILACSKCHLFSLICINTVYLDVASVCWYVLRVFLILLLLSLELFSL